MKIRKMAAVFSLFLLLSACTNNNPPSSDPTSETPPAPSETSTLQPEETSVAESSPDESSSTSPEAETVLSDYSVTIGDLTISLYENKQDIMDKLNKTNLSYNIKYNAGYVGYNEYESYCTIDEALNVYFKDDTCVRLSFINEVPQTAKGIHKDDSYSQVIEQYGDSFETHIYADHGIYQIYRYSSSDYICEFGVLPEISDGIENIEIYTPDQYPLYDYGEELPNE